MLKLLESRDFFVYLFSRSFVLQDVNYRRKALHLRCFVGIPYPASAAF